MFVLATYLLVCPRNMAMVVPKIIWQTHNYEFDELPDHLKMISKTWENLNPGWEYRYVSHNQREETFKRHPFLFSIYEKLGPVYQADLWRYLVTYQHGGVYSDMDSVCIKPLDYMLEQVNDCEMLAVPKTTGKHGKDITIDINNTTNYAYAIKQGSFIMKSVIDACVEDYQNKVGTWLCFINNVQKFENVKYFFTASYHDHRFKTIFNPDFFIDNYGEKIKYLDFIKKYDLPII